MRLVSALVVLAIATLPLVGCALSQKDASEREWQRSECNRINDQEARERCLKRIE